MHVRIERFKNIKSIDLDIGGVTLLVGGNNSGKSSVLQAIQFGVSAAQTAAMQGGGWRDGRLSVSIGQSDLIYSPIKDVLSLGEAGRLAQSVDGAIQISYGDGEDLTRVSVRKGKNRNVMLELTGEVLGSRLRSIQEPFSTLVTGLAGIPSEEEFETNIVIRRSAAKGDSNSVFRNILWQLKSDAGGWSVFQQQISRLFPGYALEVEFNPESDEFIRCSVTRNGISFPIDSCGTGVLQAIQIFSYINLFRPKILLLDEPDSHLHPNNQMLLAGELVRASENGLNVVISTHSKHLVEALIESAKLVWLKGGEVQPAAKDYEVKALMDVGALNVGERIGNPDTIFLTEDQDLTLFETLLSANGVELESCEIVSYAGCTQLGTASVLIDVLRQRHPNARYIIHRDRDFLSDEEIRNFVDKFTAMGVRAFVPAGNDMEAYFCSPEHVALVCGVEMALAHDIVNTAFHNRFDFLIRKYVNTRVENIRKSGDKPNSGDIAIEANALLGERRSRAVHGKTLFKGIRDELQSRHIAGQLIATSDALISPELLDLLR